MADLTEVVNYDAGVYQLETTDPVQGGPSGVSNNPGKNLANRTAWLKQAVDAIIGTLATLGSAAFKDAGSTAGNVLLIDGSGKLPVVDGSQLTNVAGGLGVGQAWTDVHSARAVNTIYQNTTARPIMVSINSLYDNGETGFNVIARVGSASPPEVIVAQDGWGGVGVAQTDLSFIVPPNHYYKLFGPALYTLNVWAELR